MKIKLIVIIAALIAASMPLRAQIPAQQHEFSIGIGGGMSTLLYRYPADARAYLQMGGMAGIGYTYFFDSHWGIGIGAEVALMHGKCHFNALEEHYTAKDGSENFEFFYQLQNFSETQRLYLFNIPILLHFQANRFYAAIGGKIGFPISAKSTNSAAQLQTSAYYERLDATLEDPAFMGFGKFSHLDNAGRFSLKIAGSLTAEIGLKWRLSEKHSLYTGVFADYSVNNVQKIGGTRLVEYPQSDNYTLNSLITAKAGATDKPLVEKVHLLATGIKISVAFGGGKSYAKSKIDSNSVQNMEDRLKKLADDYDQLKADEAGLKAADSAQKAEIQRLEALIKETEAQLAKLQKGKTDPAAPKITTIPTSTPPSSTPPAGSTSPSSASTTPATTAPASGTSAPTASTLASGSPASSSATPAASPPVVEQPMSKRAATKACRELGDQLDKLAAELKRLADQNRLIEERLAKLQNDRADATAPAPAVGYTADKSMIEFPIDHFMVDSYTLSDLHKQILDEKIALLKRYPDKKISIEAHTCDIGSHETNLKLSQQRAEAVRSYMIKKGIASKRIVNVEGKAETYPVVPNTSEENRLINRRVVVKIFE